MRLAPPSAFPLILLLLLVSLLPAQQRVSIEERKRLPGRFGTYNKDRTKKLYSKSMDIFMLDIRGKREMQLTSTSTPESNPRFTFDEQKIVFERAGNLFYYAAGLKGALLICHGMVDENVHFQDAVRLAQRLIELKKENWELAVFPVEDHGFKEATSWMDEYKRILKLFETNLGNR